MLSTKLFEVRDRATCIGVMATIVMGGNKTEESMLKMMGFGRDHFVHVTILCDGLSNAKSKFYPTDWNNRTMHAAHHYISKHFEDLTSGDVIDVEFILGESDFVKYPELRVPPKPKKKKASSYVALKKTSTSTIL